MVAMLGLAQPPLWTAVLKRGTPRHDAIQIKTEQQNSARDGGWEKPAAPLGAARGGAVAPRPDSLRRFWRATNVQYLTVGGKICRAAFPGEAEFLFPPLTFLQPTGDIETVTVEGLAYEVVDVRPRI